MLFVLIEDFTRSDGMITPHVAVLWVSDVWICLNTSYHRQIAAPHPGAHLVCGELLGDELVVLRVCCVRDRQPIGLRERNGNRIDTRGLRGGVLDPND